MTKEELRAHCEKQVKMCEEWAKGNDREPSGKIYEEHKLILDLINELQDKSYELWKESYEEEHRRNIRLEEKIKALEQQSIAEERYQDLIEYFGDENVAKCVLEDREEFKKWLERIKWHVQKADELARKLEQPSDCVSVEVYKQVSWERDIAIEQLRELGYSFGEKIRPNEDCVSRAEVLEMIEAIQDAGGFIGYNTYSEAFDQVDNMPPVTPTHGTCKDCKHFHNVRKDFNTCDLWTIACADNHYCADFEKRGSENGSN